jgi:putative ABC transport system permease protein
VTFVFFVVKIMAVNSGRAILRMAWRQAWRRPLQSAFLVIGVAIGVAMVVAIDLANGSARRAFELGTETVTGRATHQILGGPNGVDEGIYTALRRDLGYRLSAPVVEDYVVAVELDAQPMRLLGVDPFSENPFRNYLGTGTGGETPSYLADFMARPNSVLLSTAIAERYGLQSGDTLTVRVGGQRRELIIVGLLEPSDDLSRQALDSLLVSDISTAQEVLDQVGRLSRIDLIVPEGSEGEAELARIAEMLPPGVRIEESARRERGATRHSQRDDGGL